MYPLNAITGFEKLCEKPPTALAYSTAKEYRADGALTICDTRA